MRQRPGDSGGGNRRRGGPARGRGGRAKRAEGAPALLLRAVCGWLKVRRTGGIGRSSRPEVSGESARRADTASGEAPLSSSGALCAVICQSVENRGERPVEPTAGVRRECAEGGQHVRRGPAVLLQSPLCRDFSKCREPGKKAGGADRRCPAAVWGGRTTSADRSRCPPLEAYVFKNQVSEIVTALSWETAKLSSTGNKGEKLQRFPARPLLSHRRKFCHFSGDPTFSFIRFFSTYTWDGGC